LKEEEVQHHELLKNPSATRAIRKQRDNDDKTMDELLRIIPDAFVFEDRGKEGESEKIAFHPNPGSSPRPTSNGCCMLWMGIVFIDLHEKRIARLSGSLGTRVKFGYGLIGHVEQGGTTEITRVNLSPGVWKTSAEKIDIDGRLAMLKTINKHQEESRTGFERVPLDTTSRVRSTNLDKNNPHAVCRTAKDSYSASYDVHELASSCRCPLSLEPWS